MAEFLFNASPLPPGLSVIEASAGTGKTYALSHLVPRLLLDESVQSLDEILLVTFTKAAAAELEQRVRGVLESMLEPGDDAGDATGDGIARLRERFGKDPVDTVIGKAVRDFDRLTVSTIHSFCQRALQSEGSRCGLPVMPELVGDAAELVAELVADYWEAEVVSNPILGVLAGGGEALSLAETTRFVFKAISIPEVTFLPTPVSLSKVLEALRKSPRQFPKEQCEDLKVLLRQVGQWNKNAVAWEEIEGCLDLLGSAEECEVAGFWEAVRRLPEIPDGISGRSKANRAIKEDAQQHAIVQCAKEVRKSLESLRWHFQISVYHQTEQSLRERMRRNRQISYDGLVGALADALTAGPAAEELAVALRKRYKVALIDESQDTDARQFAIFQKIFLEGSEGHRLILIGDPKQSIYAFRGADVNTYLKAKEQAGNQVYSLTKTYRAPESLVCAVNAFFQRDNNFLKDKLDFTPATSGLSHEAVITVDGEAIRGSLEVWMVEDDDPDYRIYEKRVGRISASVATEVTRLLDAKARITGRESEPGGRVVQPKDFAVLVDTHAEAKAIEQALRERNVPCVRAEGGNVMHTDEAKELQVVLSAVLEPRRSGYRRAALSTRLLGVRATQLRMPDFDAEGRVEEQFHRWHAVWHRDGIAALLAVIDEEVGISSRLAVLPDGERHLTNLRQLVDLLEVAAREVGHDPARLLRWFTWQQSQPASEMESEERFMQLESDAKAVGIFTMHAAKGLEFPLVFCPFAWKPPRTEPVERWARHGEPSCLVEKSLLQDPGVELALQQARLEDRIRLLYVALTRAETRVWLFAGAAAGTSARAKEPSALDWVLRGDEESDFASWLEQDHASGRGLRHRHGLEALVAAGNAADVIVWNPPPPPSEASWTRESEHTHPEITVAPMPTVPIPWEMTSFSALTREKSPYEAIQETPVVLDEMTSEPANPFAEAPGGTAVGTAIHDWIQNWDFGDLESEKLGAHLRRYPLPQKEGLPTQIGRVEAMMRALRDAVLPGWEVPVSMACAEAEASEWLFQLPLAGTLSASAIATVFARHGEEEYAEYLAMLPRDELHGYLHGFIDRLAVSEGQWGVIDWKTNFLGRTREDYGESSLLACCRQHHYLLQAHLYLVALRRFLHPEIPVAGAWVVFLRGVSAGGDGGILKVQPSPELLADLDVLFAKGSGAT